MLQQILHTKLTFPAIQFLPRDTMRTLNVVFVVVCRPSVTLVHCIHMAEDIVKLLIRPGSLHSNFLTLSTGYPIPRGIPSAWMQNTRRWENFN